jgi:CheY-like chemotaxis protein
VSGPWRGARGPIAPAKVLLVDDRRDNLVALEAILQGLPVEPVAVDSGVNALKQLLKDDFAVILMDAQMPHMDGFETATRIKERERTRNVPIIFLTAADHDAQLALRGYATGAVDYLTKPLDPWVLRAKVAVFAELWTKSQQIVAQAEAADEAAALLDDARAALAALATPSPDVDGAAAILCKAIARGDPSRADLA